MPAPLPTEVYTGLLEYARTERQREIIEAIIKHGSQDGARQELGISTGTMGNTLMRIRQRAAKAGYAPEYDYTRPVPDGFKLKGVSSYYGKDGKLRGQWVKSAEDRQRQHELMMEAIEALTSEITPTDPLSGPPGPLLDNLLVGYPIGDFHLGMMSWAEETGHDWDMKIAERMMERSVDYLVGQAPAAQTGLIAILGDFFHYDSFQAVTPTNRNLLDSDTRYPKMVRAGLRIARHMITRALEKHEVVHVIVEIGNHDESSAIFLMQALAMFYENEPRVTIDISPARFHYYRFGKVLLATHHGDGAKMEQLPAIMANDRPQDWGATVHRHWWTGHVHHGRTLNTFNSARDLVGCTAESFRILAPEDAWAAGKGYRSLRDMKAIVYHREHGEVSRLTFNPCMLEE